MTTPLRLRPYQASRDLERCLAIWRAASENAHSFLGLDQIRSDEEIVRERYMPMAEITVADNGGAPAGFIALLDGFIGGLFVSPEFHRLGIGKQLVEDAASRKGTLEVEVYRENSRAPTFYGALCFHSVGEKPLDDLGRPHPLVRLRREERLTCLPRGRSSSPRSSSGSVDVEFAVQAMGAPAAKEEPNPDVYRAPGAAKG